MTRIAVIGAPRAGKTTLATKLGAELHLPVYSSDDVMVLGWWQAGDEVARLMALGNPGVYEGVTVVRALRKLLVEEDGRPVDRCFVLTVPWVPLNPGQEGLRKGCATILRHIEPELVRRGVDLVFDPTVPEAP